MESVIGSFIGCVGAILVVLWVLSAVKQLRALITIIVRRVQDDMRVVTGKGNLLTALIAILVTLALTSGAGVVVEKYLNSPTACECKCSCTCDDCECESVAPTVPGQL